MPIAADYPFLNILWTMIIFFLWVAWIWLVIKDQRSTSSVGATSTAARRRCGSLFILFVPLIGVFAYMLPRTATTGRS